MKISKIQTNLRDYNLEQSLLQENRNKDHQKVVDLRTFEQTKADRVARNIRLDLEKGRNIDIEC